jgi:general secretion pathway protein G
MLRSGARGFSLIELLVVMAVLGVLAAMVMPLAEMSLQRDRERELKRALWEIRDAIDAYKRASDQGDVARAADASGYPPTLDALITGMPSARSAGQRVYFLRRIPRDPFAPADVPPERTWGLRSYQSPPDRPEAGSDVYDVYSLSDRTGLNGVALRQW